MPESRKFVRLSLVSHAGLEPMPALRANQTEIPALGGTISCDHPGSHGGRE